MLYTSKYYQLSTFLKKNYLFLFVGIIHDPGGLQITFLASSYQMKIYI